MFYSVVSLVLTNAEMGILTDWKNREHKKTKINRKLLWSPQYFKYLRRDIEQTEPCFICLIICFARALLELHPYVLDLA